ncbi:MAG: hypothetical protein R2704_11520 [Microthrixaceae bacterium]
MTGHGRLRLAKLRAIAERHLGVGPDAPVEGSHFADGAGLVADDRAVVLVARPTRRSLGPALLWATKAVQPGDPARLDLVLDPSLPVDTGAQEPGVPDAQPAAEARLGPAPSPAVAPDLADPTDYAELPAGGGRVGAATSFGLPLNDPRAVGGRLAHIGGLFQPEVRVWLVDGGDVEELAATAAPPLEPAPWDAAADLVRLLADAGLEVSGEPGMVLGEVAGLEVARVTVLDGEPRLDIGVGRFDQELSAVAQADLPRAEALQRAADLVRLTRTPENGAHPMTRLARERWLRSHLLSEPGLVGAAELSATSGLWVRDGLKRPAPAAAIGTDEGGRPMMVVCSAGVDTDLIPAALELVDVAVAPPDRTDSTLVVALPAGDVMAATQRVAELAVRPVRIVGLTPPWGTSTARR